MKVKLTLSIAGLACVLFSSGSAQQLISLTNGYVDAGGSGLPYNTLSGPAGADTWNLLTSTTGTDLNDSTGIGTTVDFTVSGGSSRVGNGDWGDYDVLRGGWSQFTKGADTTYTISGLTVGGAYDIWLLSYTSATDGIQGSTGNVLSEGGAGTFSTTNSTSSASAQIIDNTATGGAATAWTLGVNYVLFENVIADGTGTIAFLGDADGTGDDDQGIGLIGQGPDHLGEDYAHRLHFNGLQIQAVPEPSALALLGLSGLALLARRRR